MRATGIDPDLVGLHRKQQSWQAAVQRRVVMSESVLGSKNMGKDD
jgi:hypothetical protein